MRKGQKPMVGARIPHTWMDQIEGICQETGKRPSDILKEALAAYLGKTDTDSVSSLQKRVSAVERKLQKLTTLVTQ